MSIDYNTGIFIKIILYPLSLTSLAVPATQVSVERLFSGLKFILSPLRTNMGPELLDEIMLLRYYEKC